MKYLVDVYGDGYEVIFSEDKKIVNKVIKGKNVTFCQDRIVKKPTIYDIGSGFVKIIYPNGKTTNDIYPIAKDLSHREEVGRELAKLRKERGLTQEQLSELTGLDRTNIAKIENGKYNVSIDILSRVTDALGCKIDFVEKTAD